jgi:hypothetical protein
VSSPKNSPVPSLNAPVTGANSMPVRLLAQYSDHWPVPGLCRRRVSPENPFVGKMISSKFAFPSKCREAWLTPGNSSHVLPGLLCPGTRTDRVARPRACRFPPPRCRHRDPGARRATRAGSQDDPGHGSKLRLNSSLRRPSGEIAFVVMTGEPEGAPGPWHDRKLTWRSTCS